MLQRAYDHCAACKKGYCPRDRTLGMNHNVVSPGVLRMLNSVAAEVSFETSSGLLWEVERIAERLGVEMAEDQRQDTTPFADGDLPSTLYLGIDGSASPCSEKNWSGAPASRPMEKPRLAKANSLSSAAPSLAMRKGFPCGTPGIDHLFGRHRECGHTRHRRVFIGKAAAKRNNGPP